MAPKAQCHLHCLWWIHNVELARPGIEREGRDGTVKDKLGVVTGIWTQLIPEFWTRDRVGVVSSPPSGGWYGSMALLRRLIWGRFVVRRGLVCPALYPLVWCLPTFSDKFWWLAHLKKNVFDYGKNKMEFDDVYSTLLCKDTRKMVNNSKSITSSSALWTINREGSIETRHQRNQSKSRSQFRS